MDSTSTPALASTSASPSPSASASSLDQSEILNRTPAPYGQACTSCAKAKCKCIFISNTGPGSGRGSRFTCERCTRLGRECRPSSGVRKRGAAGSKRATAGSASVRGSSGTSAASRAANLEQKLEDLVAILKAQAGSVPTPDSSRSSGGEPHLQQGTLQENVRAQLGVPAPSVTDQDIMNDVASRIVSGGPPAVTPAASTDFPMCSTVGSTPSPLPAPALDVSMSTAQAEETLALFRQNYLRFFPFIYIPPEMKAAKIQRDRPYLWLNISALCCKSPIKQAALNQRSREELAHKILVSCERNVDMLLGALCTLGWTMHFFICKPTLNATMNMAMSIVSDLRLDKPSQEDNPKDTMCFKSPDFIRVIQSTVRTMEERRATLACYVFCSSGSAFLRCQSMRWTSHMEDSLKLLAANPECEGDQILVLMVRIRRLMQSISQTQEKWISECDGYGSLKPPAGIYVKYFRQCLQLIKDQLPEPLKDNLIATSLILSAEMIITDMPFSNCICWGQMPEWHPDAPTRSGAQSQARYTDPGRVEAIFATLQTSKAYFEHFLTFSLPDFLSLSFPVLLNFFRASQILYRLRLLDDPGWDRSVVSNSIDLLAAIDLIANRYAQLPGLYGFLTETDSQGNEVTNFYVKCSKTFHSTLPMWRAHFVQAEALKTGTGTGTCVDADAGSGTGSQVPPATMMGGVATSLNPNTGARMNYPGMTNFMLPELYPMDFSMDDVWCNEMLSSWDIGVLGPFQ
ncbi:hypothetical protein HD806DRAFT_401951 [Xylariaceae sp. AK1471]|nr:hypothetical protein HD806DRAFT_401951 [Xylariaceae sp. AK1471]